MLNWLASSSQGTFMYCTCYQKQSVEVEQWHIHYQACSMHGNLPHSLTEEKDDLVLGLGLRSTNVLR